MKVLTIAASLLALALSPAFAAEDHKGHAHHPAQSAEAHKGMGVIKSVDAKGKKLNLAHDPIPSLKWPAMTMDLAIADAKLLKNLKPGAKVEFELKPGEKGQYVISAIKAVK
jgi:Cu/Ag efflux protein CusF